MTNRTLMRVLFAITVIFQACTLSIHGQTFSPDTRQEWRIGVAEFSGINVSKENNYLLSSYPYLLVEALSRSETHTIDEVEAEAIRQSLINEEIEKRKKELYQLYRKRDRLLFNRSATEQELVNVEKRITEARTSVENTVDIDARSIDIEIPIVIAQSGNERILPVVTLDPAVYMRERDLDFLIWGTLEEIEGYLFMSIFTLNAAIGETKTLTSAASRDEILNGASGIVERLTHMALGREWAGLAITVQPPEGGIWIDGRFVGIGEIDVDLVETGTHEIRATAPGHSTVSESVQLLPGEERSLEIELWKLTEDSFEIVTYPSGADIYTRSQWLGVSPLLLQLPALPAVLKIQKPGYIESMLTVNAATQSDADISLVPDQINKNALIEAKRDRFYMAFGFFAISLPLPMVFFDATNQLTGALNYELQFPFEERNPEEQLRLLKKRSIAYSSYIGGFFTSAALLVWTFTELFEYINLVELAVD